MQVKRRLAPPSGIGRPNFLSPPSAESRELTENSPALEGLKAKGQEVLLLTDPIDDFVIQALHQYKDKPLKAADKGQAGEVEVDAARKEQFQALLDFCKEKLPDVKDVRLSSRLKESASCLVSDEAELAQDRA